MARRSQPEATMSPEALGLLREAGLERDALGERLARYEFQALRRELETGDPFEVRVEITPLSDAPRAPRSPDLALDADVLARLPVLPVPLGRIAWVHRPTDLPVSGIYVRDMAGRDLCKALVPLLTEHHRAPFARLVFLCQSLVPVHVLGRYGFLCHHIGDTVLPDIAGVFSPRYGMAQIRDLEGGAKLWQRG